MPGFWPKAMAVALVLVILAGGLAFYFYKKCAQPPALPVTVTMPPPDTVLRVDTVEFAAPALLAQNKALQATIGAFLADTTQRIDTACIALLRQAGAQIESLQAALALPPTVRLTLADSSLAYIRPSVRYEGKGTQGISTWSYTHFWAKYPRFLSGGENRGRVGRLGFGGGFSLSGAAGGHFGLRLRLKQNLILGADKNLGRNGWGFEGSCFIF